MQNLVFKMPPVTDTKNKDSKARLESTGKDFSNRGAWNRFIDLEEPRNNMTEAWQMEKRPMAKS